MANATTPVIQINEGKVGIGITTPNAKLQVGATVNVNATGISFAAGAAVGNLISRSASHNNWFPYTDGNNYYTAGNHIFRNAATSIEYMRVNSSGKVGIGVTAPTSTVHVDGLQTNSGSTSAHLPTGTMRLNFNGGFSADDYGASLVFTQRWWTGSTGQVAMGQIAGVKETGSGNYGGGLAFFTSNNTSNNLLERLRINELGNVGIGVIDPEKRLEVKSDTTYDGIMLDVLSAPEITFRDRGNSDTRIGTGRHQLDGFHIDTYSGNALLIKGSNRFVGIGTTSPDTKLQVSGTSAVPSVSGTLQGGIFSVEGSSTVSLDMGTTGAPGFYTWMQAHDAGTGVNYILSLNPLGGNVGIGTESPDSKLDVTGGDITINTAATGFMNFKYGSAGSEVSRGTITTDGIDLKINSVADLILLPSGTNKVGVGLTNPSYKFHVSGASIVQALTSSAADVSIVFINTTSTNYIEFFNGEYNLYQAGGSASNVTLKITNAGAVRFPKYSGTLQTGTPTYLLGTDASGNVVKTLTTPSPVTSQAASLYDLIPNGAFTTTYAFTSTAGTYSEVMEGSDVITASGTYTVQMFVNDHAVGGTQYSETYSGIMSWGSATNTNSGSGDGTISEIVLHRSGHATNTGVTYLRTRETTSLNGGKLKLEIMGNLSYTGASNVVFKFVRLI